MNIIQGLKRAAQINGGGTATIDGERYQTWREFVERVARLAAGLLSLGLNLDDRVAMLAYNSDRHLEYYFATIWAGGIFVPLNTRLAPVELAHILADSGAQIWVIGGAFEPQLAEILAHASAPEHIISIGNHKPGPDVIESEALINRAVPVADSDRGDDDIATILYTSGTTGIPKGVMLTHTNAITNALSSLAIMNEGTPWTYLHTAPMFHIADSQWNVGVTLQAGTHVFTKKFDPEEVLKIISQHHITHLALVPTMINMLCDVPEIEKYNVSSLRKVNFGGSPISPIMIKRAREVFPGCEFIQGYGQTETSPNISMLLDKYNTDEGEFAGKIESAGQPVFLMEVRIVDSSDEEVPRGVRGEITTRGPHVMAGYWDKPEETAHALRGGWMHTGDIGYLDEDGFLFIIDRLKDMIISGGENIYSVEVEHVLYQHPAVAECAVIGIPHEKWGESVHAIVIPKEDLAPTAEELIEHCRKYIAGYKCPRSIEFRSEPMPMSGAGKVLKKILRAPYWPS